MTDHADDCDWHVDQYPWECTCSPDYNRGYREGAWTERAFIVKWLREQDGHGYDLGRADCIEAGEHLK